MQSEDNIGPDQRAHLCVVYSGHFMLFDIYYSIHRYCKRTTKVLISLRWCAGWSGPALSANYIKVPFVRCASYVQVVFLCSGFKSTLSPQFYFIIIFMVICVSQQCTIEEVLFVLRFNGPVNPMGSCRARSVYLTTRLLGRLCPLSG